MTHTQKNSLLSVIVLTVLALPPAASAQNPCPCVAPNSGGTAVLMPTTCTVGYLGFMQIVDGLPGATIDCNAELTGFANTTEIAGGSLGGDIQTWDAILELQMSGTGTLNFFNRSVFLQVSGVSHTAPRTPGDAVQTFAHELISLQGELFGDPDFCILRVKAGTDQALPPSPGQTTVTRLGPAGSDFAVDSFFDIAYSIEFDGCPGSVLEDYAGTTEDTHRFQLCEQPVPVESIPWGRLKTLSW
jgi:hypothetical protein